MAARSGPFRRILLAFNPAAGPRRRHRRPSARVAEFLSASGAQVRELTLGSESMPAGLERDSFDAIFICGGDGTLNQVLQNLVSQRSEIPVGVVPIGSGNLFAGSIGMPRDPIAAAKALLAGTPTKMALGTIEGSAAASPRYWTAAAGIGADARVICGVNPQWKARFGIGAYYAESVRQLCSPRLELPWFRAEFSDHSGSPRAELVTQVIAERMEYFGNAVSRAPAALKDDEMRIVLIKSDTRWPYLRFGAALLASQFDLRAFAGSRVEAAVVKELVCTPIASTNGHQPPAVLAEVDGEMIGDAPVRLAVQPQAATLILPGKAGD